MDKFEKFYLVAAVISSIAVGVYAYRQPDRTYRYQVVEKTTEISSGYNWWTNGYKTESRNVMVVKDLGTGRIFRAEVSDDTYYRFDKGDTFVMKSPLYSK